MKIYHFKSVDSTSSYLKKNYSNYDDMTIISSDFQTNGHGRYNRSWISNDGENLLFSILIKNKNLINKYAHLSLASAVAIFNVLKELNVKNVMIKWPNDVYVNDKKICGILLESISFSNEIKALVIGVGLNVNSSDFKDLIATSIYNETGNKVLIKEITTNVYNSFITILNEIENNNINYLKIVRDNNYLINKEVYALINNKKTLVQVIDINDDNSLKVKKDNEICDLHSGEISFNV